MSDLKLTYLGTFWFWNGDYAYINNPDGRQARITVDSLGETWVDIRVKPEGGFFHSQQVEAYRSFKTFSEIVADLREQGFTEKRYAVAANRVRQRDL